MIKVLVVDDQPVVARVHAEMVSKVDGFEVVGVVHDGGTALGRVCRGGVDLVLLDLTMPGMDGWTFRARQRSDPRLARIPTVVISASYDGTPQEIAALAPDAFLAKPFELGSLIDALRRVCAAPAPA